jgi:TonB family protein
MSESLAASPIVHALGLALVHFLWQGAAIALLSAAALALFARAAASTRYVVACSGLAAMIMTPVLTLFVLANIGTSAPPLVLAPPPSTGSMTALDAGPMMLSATGDIGGWRTGLDAALPGITLTWTLVVLALTLRLAHGWVRVQRIRRKATNANGEALRNAIGRMATALRIRKTIRVTESPAVDVPTVIGWLRPMILVPASALAQLSPVQLEAIVAHELAHIRRHDYIVNALQNVAETLFFYHPGVWWLSRQVRIEREHCCDDLAVEACGDRLLYARALATLEESRQPLLAFGMSATGGSLLSRVRRLLGAPDARRPRAPIALVLCLAAVATAPLLGTRAEGAPEQRAAAESAPAQNAPSRRPSSDATETFLREQLLSSEAKLAAYSAAHSQNDSGLAEVLRQYASLRAKYDQLLAAKAQDGSVSAPVAPPQDAVRAVERRLTQATLAGDAVALAALLDDDYVAVNQAGTTMSKADAMEMFRNQRIQTMTVTPGSIRIANDVATVTGTQVEVRPQGTDVMLFTRVWTRRPGGDWRLRSSTQFRDPRALQAGPPAASSRRPPPPPPPPPPPGAPLRVGGDVREPRKIKSVSPVYPAEARAARIQGIVIIDAIIDGGGNVVNPRILRSIPQLDQAALDAVSQWKYEPPLLNGVPISVIMTVTVNFTLPSAEGAQGPAATGDPAQTPPR